ncbi:MAG TPA: hypothetical protein PK858_03545 [Saprospiraceae bacterium]|nr:hypothetical protein [Saprospiraceae bacterium]
MRRILFPLLLIFICPVPSALSAQPSYDLKVKWDNVYPDHAPEVMHDFIMLDDGRVAVVGTIQTDKRTDGFFALFEAGTFRRIMHLTFGGPGNDALTGVAYGGDFNFYAVGYRETPDKGLQAWAIVIDEETGKGTEKQIGGPEDEQFHKIIWLPEEGHGLIAGTRSSQEGYVWLSQIDGTQINPIDNSVGDGIIGEVVGMEKSPDGAWIGGYTRKVKNYTRSGDVWVIKVNADGMLSESIRRISARPGQELLGLTGTIDGELYLSGKIGNANGDSDVWLAEIRPGERDFRTLSFGSDVQDVATSLFRTPGHFKWLVVRKPKALTVQVYSDTINHNYAAYEVVRNEDFHVNRIINIGDNLYLLAGTSYAASRNDGRLRMLCLHANETIKIKDPPEVTVQKIIFDDNNNGILQPGETGALRFIAAVRSDYPLPGHQEALLANCFAQSAALAFGKTVAEARSELEGTMPPAVLASLLPHKVFPGNQPSSTLLLSRLDPQTLGALIALYEHKVFVQGVIWGLNSFDQWGVELGKAVASSILPAIGNPLLAEKLDASTRSLLAFTREHIG